LDRDVKNGKKHDASGQRDERLVMLGRIEITHPTRSSGLSDQPVAERVPDGEPLLPPPPSGVV
jgi:hypothetical protein